MEETLNRGLHCVASSLYPCPCHNVLEAHHCPSKVLDVASERDDLRLVMRQRCENDNFALKSGDHHFRRSLDKVKQFWVWCKCN